MLTQPCLLMSVRVLAQDENTVISFVIHANIRVLLCAYLISHQLQGNLYIKIILTTQILALRIRQIKDLLEESVLTTPKSQ